MNQRYVLCQYQFVPYVAIDIRKAIKLENHNNTPLGSPIEPEISVKLLICVGHVIKLIKSSECNKTKLIRSSENQSG